MSTEVLNEVERDELGRRAFEPFMPLFVVLVLWAVLAALRTVGSYAYLDGYADGAFTILVVSAVARIVAHFRDVGGRDLVDARSAMVRTLSWGTGVLAVAGIGLTVYAFR